jgi:cyclopropane fatty-acyl-phospholipid synthase-like methyltransferase
MANTSRVDTTMFAGEHYLGKPADFTDKIITRRVGLVNRIAGFTNKNYSLVDIGCGNGASMFLLSEKFKDCTGLEVNDQHQAAFEAYQVEHGVSNCSFHIKNIETEKAKPTFERLISFEVIEHLTDDKFVSYYYDILKPGGLAAISVPNKWWIFETHGARLPLLPWNRVPFFSWLPRFLHERFANARIYTKARIRHVMERAGFEVLDMQYITAPMDVLKEGWLKRFLIRYIFNTETTRIPFLSTSIFVVARKK